MPEFKGNLYNANSADCQQVVVRVTENGLELTRDDVPVSILPLSALEMKLGGHDGRRLIVSDTTCGITLIMTDLTILDALEQPGMVPAISDNVKEVRDALILLPKKERQTWAIVIAAVIIAGVALYASVDLFVGLAVQQIPPALEKQLGNLVLANYGRNHTLMDSGPEVTRVRAIVNRLAAQLGETPYKFQVYVEQTTDVNAMAMPGGNIVVLSGLLNNAKNDSEIAGVLGHEIGHVVNRHTLRSALHQAGLMGCFSIIFQGQGQDQAVWLANLIKLDALQFGRSQEDDADRTGVVLVSKADYDPRGLIAFFERAQKMQGKMSNILDNKTFEILSTHPCTPERIARIKKEIEQLEAKSNSK